MTVTTQTRFGLLLWYSTDQGRTWDVQVLSPKKKSIKFRAETDGEYWFALTYVDRNDDGTAAKPIISAV